MYLQIFLRIAYGRTNSRIVVRIAVKAAYRAVHRVVVSVKNGFVIHATARHVPKRIGLYGIPSAALRIALPD